ncbi:MAG TPA: hypothetical protein VIC59_05285 [Gemmatimonadota bacterium]|jgi:tetratricopeptide (TPR) repeat protein
MKTFVVGSLALAALLTAAPAPASAQGASAAETVARSDSARADTTPSDPRSSSITPIHESASDSLRPVPGSSAARVAELVEQGDAAAARLEPAAALDAYQAAVGVDPSSYDALWRAGRTLIDLGELQLRGNEQKDAFNKALKYAERAIKVNPSGAQGHLARAYALDRVALFEGGRTRIRLAREVKSEALRAIDLDPLLDQAYHILGEWNYRLADMGLVSRLVTKTLLGGMPDDVSWENAAHYFQLAIQADPERIDHHLAYARTLQKLNRKDEARAELGRALELPPRDLGDSDRKQEAQDLLERLS